LKVKKGRERNFPHHVRHLHCNYSRKEKRDKNKRITRRGRNKEKKKRSMVGGVQSSITIVWFLVIFLAS